MTDESRSEVVEPSETVATSQAEPPKPGRRSPISKFVNGLARLGPRLKAVGGLLEAVAAVAAILAFIGYQGFSSWSSDAPAASRPVTPVVLSIYPSDAFGPALRQGLDAGARAHAGLFELRHLGYLSATQLKQGEISGLLAEVSAAIKQGNVIAVVGPGVSEATSPLLQAVADSGVKVPVIVNSAISRRLVNWDTMRADVPLFRLSSGIDRRAQEFVRFMQAALGRRKTLHLLVEHNPNGTPSFGELFRDEITRADPLWERHLADGNIVLHDYDNSNVAGAFASIRNVIDDSSAIVMNLGLGSSQQQFLQNLFRGTRMPARFGGWMTAYAVADDIPKAGPELDHLFDITDLPLRPYHDATKPDAYLRFEKSVGTVTPANRDQVYAFDAILCLAQALTTAKSQLGLSEGQNIAVTAELRQRLVEALQQGSFDGVSGPISFNANGENFANSLRFVGFDRGSGSWKELNTNDLIR